MGGGEKEKKGERPNLLPKFWNGNGVRVPCRPMSAATYGV
jgi:hypothetical protein